MIYNRALKNNYGEIKDSRVINILITLYITTIILFSTQVDLNIISQVFFFVAFGGCCLYMLLHGKNFRLDKYLIIAAFFIGYCFIGLLWSEDRINSIGRIITLVQLFLMSFVFFSYISNYSNIEKFIKGFIVASILCCIMVIGYYGIGEYIRLMLLGARLGEPINNVNSIGLYTSTGALMCFYYAYSKGERRYYILMLLPTLVAFGTGSRKALALLVLGIGLLVFIKYRKEANIKEFFKLVVAVCAVVIAIMVMSNMELFGTTFGRISKMFNSGHRDNSAQLRINMIKAGMEVFKANPYGGVGIGNSKIITQEYLGYETYLHNNFIELLASIGIFGFVIYYSMHIYLIVNLYKIIKTTGDDISVLMLVMVMGYLVMDYGMVSYYGKMTYIYLTMAASVVSIGKRKIAEMEKEENERLIEQNKKRNK